MRQYHNSDAPSNTGERDKPLSFHWKPDAPISEKLDLPRARSKRQERAREAILTEAVLVGQSGPRWISYSRTQSWWSVGTRYRGGDFTYATVIPTIDELTRLGLLEHEKAKPRTLSGRQSRFRASFALLQAVSK